jgi:hypothetical protein
MNCAAFIGDRNRASCPSRHTAALAPIGDDSSEGEA